MIKALGVIGILLAAIAIYVAIQPADFKVSREIVITAKPEFIFPHINDSEKFSAWNPWMKIDPNVKKTFEGPSSGVGSVTTWEGNKDIGAGAMTVTESETPKFAKMRLDYKKPFEGTNFAQFDLRPEGSNTVVTWTISGKNQFLPRLICTLLMINMDKMVGDNFDKGLAELKKIAEAQPASN